MNRRIVAIVCCAMYLGVGVGCAQMRSMFGGGNKIDPQQEMKKPSQPTELRKLEPFVGTWEGTAEMVYPTTQQMKAAMPAGEEMPTSFKGGGKTEWAMDGMALRTDGWYEMGDDQKINMVEYWTWDPSAGKYRVWSVSDWGECGNGWVTADQYGRTFTFNGSATDAHGHKKKYNGTMRVIDNNTMEYHFVEKGPMGKMEFKGTSKRKS